MLEQPICKLCKHEFKFHQSNDSGMTWFCEAGNCSCDNFYPEDSRSGQFDKYYLN